MNISSLKKDEGNIFEERVNFLEIFVDCGFRMNANKSHLFMFKTKIYGHVLSDGKVRYYLKSPEALINMKQPRKAGDIQQLIYAITG